MTSIAPRRARTKVPAHARSLPDDVDRVVRGVLLAHAVAPLVDDALSRGFAAARLHVGTARVREEYALAAITSPRMVRDHARLAGVAWTLALVGLLAELELGDGSAR